LSASRKIVFFPAVASATLREIAAWTGATLADDARGDERIADVAALEAASPGDLTFLDNPRYLPQLRASRAAAVFLQDKHRADACRLRRAGDAAALSGDGGGDGQAFPLRLAA